MNRFKRFLDFMCIDPDELTLEQLKQEMHWIWFWPLFVGFLLFLPGLLRGVE